jgi:hypothetical protein
MTAAALGTPGSCIDTRTGAPSDSSRQSSTGPPAVRQIFVRTFACLFVCLFVCCLFVWLSARLFAFIRFVRLHGRSFGWFVCLVVFCLGFRGVGVFLSGNRYDGDWYEGTPTPACVHPLPTGCSGCSRHIPKLQPCPHTVSLVSTPRVYARARTHARARRSTASSDGC